MPGYWCLAHADLEEGKIHYYDPLYHGPGQNRALDALGEYIDQVHRDQEMGETAGAASLPAVTHIHPRQPGGVSCGICILIEIQRIVDCGVYGPREEVLTET